MLKAYTVNELAEKEQSTRQAIHYRIKKGSYYIPVRLDGAQYTRNKKGYTVRYIIKSELKEFLFT
jgi:predicted DNA-binding protein YlxM (UPF0122 family)